ncbi:MAG: hypothetical protein IJI36_17940 [Kiritimatiellae bacterium]|nr:hypothetical protein [Kiritimatiellia bacterium]
MGKGEHGHFTGTLGADIHHNLTDNLPSLTAVFKATPEGYFGIKGKGKTSTRRIANENPLATAHKFFKLATDGGKKDEKVSSGDERLSYVMKDGSRITMRLTSSSDGSPAVDIVVSKTANGFVKNQKIHFVKGEGK